MNRDKTPEQEQNHDRLSGDMSRRDFVTSIAAGLAVASSAASTQGLSVTETDVNIKTPDGMCDAAFIYPDSARTGLVGIGGFFPGVLLWPDAFGLRPAMREMGKRLAAEGFTVLVPNPFYRTAKAPVFDPQKFSFQNAADMARLKEMIGGFTGIPGAVERDAVAYIAFLDAQRQVDITKKIGTQGYCMGGPLVVRTAAAVPNRVGAGASFHGGGLATAAPDSPHLLAPKIKARMYFAIAANDDARDPEAKNKLREAFTSAKVPAEVELYPNALHGWCVPDMPLENGKPIYNKEDAEKAWAKLIALYKKALA